MVKAYKIAVLPGDGIGSEVIGAAVKVLKTVEEKTKAFKLDLVFGEAGLNSIPKYGTNLPEKTIELLKSTAACLKGPMTTPETPGTPPSVALQIRKLFRLYASVRPCASFPGIPVLKTGIDLVIVRENTEGMYSNIEFDLAEGSVAVALRVISRAASERIARFAFKLAVDRRRHLSYVHKANILRMTDGVFNGAVLDVAKDFPSITIDNYHIDNVALQLIKKPESFDVIVTTNLFGDIISDEAAQLTGGLGLAPSANLGDSYGMFEPVHGSAPDIVGKGIANPIATILSAKMMLEYLNEKDSASLITQAVSAVLAEGKLLTRDLAGKAKTSEVTEAIVSKI